MILPVVYLSEAQDDVDAAFASYEQRQNGLGDRFLEALRDRVDQICANPALYAVLLEDVRAAPLRRFPYVVYYQAETDRVVVIAVQHGPQFTIVARPHLTLSSFSVPNRTANR